MSTPGTTAALPFLDPPGQSGSMGRLGPYEVLQILGQGAVGIVLKGYEPRLGRHVAIKVLAPQLVHNAAARRRFAREGKATAALGHDNIVAVHAVEDEGPRPYLVMEYVDGASLQQRLDRAGALPLAEVVRVGGQAARGLAAAHAHGLVHRDVKPGNILVEAGTGRVKLTDFGMVQHQDSVVSQTDVLAGTPLYMSPEQARGDKVDARSDLFSLGSVLYALCAGRPPFTGTGPLAVLRQIGESAPPPLRQLNPAVPDWLAELIARMHDHDPAARPAADEVARILEEHQSDPALAPRPRRRRAWLVTAVLCCLAATLVAAEAAGADLRQRLPLWLSGRVRLVVRCDDPETTVRLAGRDEELVGEGEEIWTLPAGHYLVLTSRPGRPRQETPLRITRGLTRSYHVQAPAQPPVVGPFVVRSPDGGPPRSCAHLGEAITQARAGDTIEVHGDGPFAIAP